MLSTLLRCCVLTVVMVSPTLAQTPYADPTHGFSLTIPPGWVAKTPQEVKEFDAAVGGRMSDRNFRFIGGFRLEDESQAVPYILVQETTMPMDGVSWEVIEKEFDAASYSKSVESKVKEDLPDLVRSATMEKPTVDRATGRAFLGLVLTDATGAKVRGLSVMHFTRNGAVQLNFYTTADRYEMDIAQFEPFLASFKLDPGKAFVPSQPRSALSRIGTKAAIGAAIGVALGFGHWITRKKKAA